METGCNGGGATLSIATAWRRGDAHVSKCPIDLGSAKKKSAGIR